jgi:hypothetical protein
MTNTKFDYVITFLFGCFFMFLVIGVVPLLLMPEIFIEQWKLIVGGCLFSGLWFTLLCAGSWYLSGK